MDKEQELTEEQRFAITAAAQAFCNRGITISCPWEGDLDDEEREQFDALVAAIDAHNTILRRSSDEQAEVVEFGWAWRNRDDGPAARWDFVTTKYAWLDRDFIECKPVYASPPAVAKGGVTEAVEAARMARTRLINFANEANAGRAQAGGRELDSESVGRLCRVRPDHRRAGCWR